METLPRRIKIRKGRIEKKYTKLVEELIDKMKDASMGELWAELDKLKLQMKEDFEKAGVVLEG